MIFNKETWKKVGKGFLVYDCCFRDPDLQAFVLVENTQEDRPPLARFLYTYNDEVDPKERYFVMQQEGFNYERIACRPQVENEVIAVGMGEKPLYYNADRCEVEEKLPCFLDSTVIGSFAIQICRVGDSLIAVGDPRRAWKRIGKNDWQDLTAQLQLSKEILNGVATEDTSWNDCDGISDSNMYVVGGFGDVWFFDGDTFSQCDFPSNELLYNVCCDDEGQVYIGGNLGRLWKGSHDAWELISEQEFTVNWRDIKFFKGHLFLGSDYGLWELVDGEVVPANIPEKVRTCAGRCIDISYDKDYMLTGGSTGAAVFDGQDWKVLFESMALEKDGE